MFGATLCSHRPLVLKIITFTTDTNAQCRIFYFANNLRDIRTLRAVITLNTLKLVLSSTPPEHNPWIHTCLTGTKDAISSQLRNLLK